MADWRALVRERLAGVPLDPADEIDIVEELAQHVEDRYRDLRAAGVADAEAHSRSLAEIDQHLLSTELPEVRRRP